MSDSDAADPARTSKRSAGSRPCRRCCAFSATPPAWASPPWPGSPAAAGRPARCRTTSPSAFVPGGQLDVAHDACARRCTRARDRDRDRARQPGPGLLRPPHAQASMRSRATSRCRSSCRTASSSARSAPSIPRPASLPPRVVNTFRLFAELIALQLDNERSHDRAKAQLLDETPDRRAARAVHRRPRPRPAQSAGGDRRLRPARVEEGGRSPGGERPGDADRRQRQADVGPDRRCPRLRPRPAAARGSPCGPSGWTTWNARSPRWWPSSRTPTRRARSTPPIAVPDGRELRPQPRPAVALEPASPTP